MVSSQSVLSWLEGWVVVVAGEVRLEISVSRVQRGGGTFWWRRGLFVFRDVVGKACAFVVHVIWGLGAVWAR